LYHDRSIESDPSIKIMTTRQKKKTKKKQTMESEKRKKLPMAHRCEMRKQSTHIHQINGQNIDDMGNQ
jgi:hypothetical protein